MIKKTIFSIAMASALFAAPAYADLNHGTTIGACASSKEVRDVKKAYEKAVGAPLYVVSNMTSLPEVRVATGVASENRVATKVSPELVKEIWATIDGWGEDTFVNLVFTMGGGHVLDFKSKVPVTQVDLDDGWIDIYADKGDGVHGHLWLDRISSVHALDLPGSDDVRTRSISFYGPDGKLAMGVYASISTQPFDPFAVSGFERTKALIASHPQLCN